MATRKYPKMCVGDKFGFWTIVELDLRDRHNHKVVKCQCVCGNFGSVAANLLHSGRTTNCGCQKWNWRKNNLLTDKVKIHERYGYLLVEEVDLRHPTGGNLAARCLCHCGKSILVNYKELIGGQKSCGCMDCYKDYTGQKFGRLLVIEYLGKKLKLGNHRGRHDRWWRARCDCGNIWEGKIVSLTGGQVKSCGCARDEANRRSGPDSPHYRHDLSEEDRILRGHRHYLTGYSEWQASIREKYNYKCCICNSNNSIECHHLDGFNENIEKATDINNGVLLCHECHRFFHKIYGNKDVTREKFVEFYKNCTGNDYLP